MSTYCRFLVLFVLLSWPQVAARAEVLVRWDLDQVPSRESLGITTLVIPAAKAALLQEAVTKGYRVYLDMEAATLSAAAPIPESVSGVLVRGAASAQQLDALRQRLRAPGARVLPVDERGAWPHVRLNWVTMRNNVLQVSSRTSQPWLESNAALGRIGAVERHGAPFMLSPRWEPNTVADTDQGPALENYLVAIAEAGTFGYDLVLPLHERFERNLLMGTPAARADWQEIRRYLEFYSWDLPRQYRRVSNIGVVTADPMGAIEVLRLLSRHNLPFELMAPGALRDDALKGFALAIVLDPVGQAQVGALTRFARSGGIAVLNGPAQGVKWEGAVQLVDTERHVSYRLGEGRVLELLEPIANPDEFARDMREVLGTEGRVLDVWNGITVMLAPYQDPGGDTMLVTALNYAYDDQPIQVRVRGTFSLGYSESPGSAPVLLPLRQRDGHTEFVLPALRVGGRVFLSREHAP